MTRRKKPAKYRKPIIINVGVIVFGIIAFYIVLQVILYMNKEHVAIYEVKELSIADNNIFQGVAIREEKIVQSKKAGYLNYYVGDSTHVAKDSIIYTIDQNGTAYEMLKGEEGENSSLSEDIQAEIKHAITNLQNTFSDTDFKPIYSFKYDMENTVLELVNVNMMNNLESVLENTDISSLFDIVKTKASGIVSYTMDNMESLTEDQITKETFALNNYVRKQLRTKDLVEKESPIYKLVTSEDWKIIIPLQEEQYKKLKDLTRVEMTFLKNSISTYASISCYQKEEEYYAKLELDNYMIYFIKERYIDIELMIESVVGLKIPNSSIIEDEFYKIPLEYLVLDEKSNEFTLEKRVSKENGELVDTMEVVNVVYQDETDGYISKKSMNVGDMIVNPVNNKTYTLSLNGKLLGVYNVNQGYAIFKRIEQLYKNNEYTIVAKETSNGLSTYDHIVLNVELLDEIGIIY